MRRSLLKPMAASALAAALALLVTGCDEDDTPEGGQEILEIIPITAATYDCNPGDVCALRYQVNFHDVTLNDTTRYYYAMAICTSFVYGDPNPLDTVFSAVRKFRDSTTHDLSLFFHYFDVAAPCECDVEVRRSTDSVPIVADPPGLEFRSPQLRQAISIPAGSFTPADCFTCACTEETTPTDGLYHAEAWCDDDDVVSAKATIIVRYGNLCGLTNSRRPYSHISAYVGITNYSSVGQKIWGQVGYTSWRDEGQWEINTTAYLEVWDGHNPVFVDLEWLPKTDSAYTFDISLDPSNGLWSVRIGDSFSYEHTWSDWTGLAGERVHWSGEIRGHETDMPGVVSAPCQFTDCTYGTIWETSISPDFGNNDRSNWGSDDREEWEIYKTGPGSFRLWDKSPLIPH